MVAKATAMAVMNARIVFMGVCWCCVGFGKKDQLNLFFRYAPIFGASGFTSGPK